MDVKQYGGTLSPDYLQKRRAEGLADDDIAQEMAQSSPAFAQQLDRIRANFNSDPAATTAFLNTRFYGDAQYTPEPQEEKGYLGRVLDRIYQAGEDVRENLDSYNKGEILGGQAMLRSATDMFRGVLSPATEATSTIVGGALKATGADKAIAAGVDAVANSKLGQAVAPVIQDVQEGYNALPQDSGWRELAHLGGAAVDALDVYGSGKALQAGGKALKATGQAIRHPVQTLRGGAKGAAQATDDMVLSGKAKEAVDKGLDENLVRFIAERGDDERHLMKAMTEGAEEGTRRLGGSTKHKEIVGQQILRNAEHVIDAKNRVGKALGNITNTMADEPVDLTDVARQVHSMMGSKGVVFDTKGRKIVAAAGFADDEIPVLQKVADFFSLNDEGKLVVKFKNADFFRKKLFAELDMAKSKLAPTAGGQSAFSVSDRVADDVRSLLLKKMGGMNPSYRKLATAYAELSGEPADFYRLLGYKGNLDDIGSQALGTGEKAMRVLGNASARPTEALQKLFNLSRKYGFESGVDEMQLIRYADELENIFPITPTRSLRGEVSRAGKSVGEAAIERGATRAAVDTVTGKAVDLYRWARGMTPENRMRLLRELLDAPADQSFAKAAAKALPDNAVDALPAAAKTTPANEAVAPVAAAVSDLTQQPS